MTGRGSIAVVVEDAISASVIPIINRNLSGVGLLGTSLLSEHIDYLRKYTSVVVALDPDARDKTLKIARQIRTAGMSASALCLQDDIKYQRESDIDSLFRLERRQDWEQFPVKKGVYRIMKLRAMIIIDFEANDIMDAKDKIEQLQNDLDPIEGKYGDIELTVKERRGVRSEKRSS